MTESDKNRTRDSRVVVSLPTKSVALALLLALFLGPLGMLYASVSGAIIMILLMIVLFFVSAAAGSPGLAGLSLLLGWFICIVWSVVAANSYNAKILAKAN